MMPIIVIGAGAAGHSAAFALARGGRSVVLVDAGAEPLQRFEGTSIEPRQATAFHAERGTVWLWLETGIETLAWSSLVIATGAEPAFAPDEGYWREAGTLPDNRLAAALGCAYRFDPAAGWLLPEVDGASCATSVAGVFVVGGARGLSGGAEAADDGARCAAAILGSEPVSGRAAAPSRTWSWPGANIPDGFETCPCSGVAAGEVREAVTAGAITTDRLAQFSGAGAGECRGRRCGLALAHLLTEATGENLAAVLRPMEEFPAVSVPIPAMVASAPAGLISGGPLRDEGRL